MEWALYAYCFDWPRIALISTGARMPRSDGSLLKWPIAGQPASPEPRPASNHANTAAKTSFVIESLAFYLSSLPDNRTANSGQRQRMTVWTHTNVWLGRSIEL